VGASSAAAQSLQGTLLRADSVRRRRDRRGVARAQDSVLARTITTAMAVTRSTCLRGRWRLRALRIGHGRC